MAYWDCAVSTNVIRAAVCQLTPTFHVFQQFRGPHHIQEPPQCSNVRHVLVMRHQDILELVDCECIDRIFPPELVPFLVPATQC